MNHANTNEEVPPGEQEVETQMQEEHINYKTPSLRALKRFPRKKESSNEGKGQKIT